MIWAGILGAWSRFAKLPRGFHIALAVLALCAALFTLHKCAVSDAVQDDRKAAQGEVAKKQLGAERSANESDAARQTEIRDNDADTRKAIDDAVAKNPEAARAPAGAASRAAAERLRNRSTGNSAPAR